MHPPPELLSPRLRLRRLRDGDAAALCAYRSLADVARYQSWESFGAEAAAALIAEQRTPAGTPGSWVQLGLTLAESGELIGDCGILRLCSREVLWAGRQGERFLPSPCLPHPVSLSAGLPIS